MSNPFSTLAAADAVAAIGVVQTALANIQANPTALNVAAQGAALPGNLVAAAPAIESIDIGGFAAWLDAQLVAYKATLATPPAA